MKKHVLVIVTLIMICSSGFCLAKKEYREFHLFFSVCKLSYGEKKNKDSISYETEETLRKEWNIKINSTDKKHYSNNFIASGFRINVMLGLDDHLAIKVYENLFGIEKEIFSFKQNKGSTVRYIYYGSASEPYLIQATLTASLTDSENMHYWIPPPRFIQPPYKKK
jgi:hypothetical protein